MAYNLSLDLRYLKPLAWNYWQAVDTTAGDPPTTWGLIQADYDDEPAPGSRTGNLVGVANKYFVFAHYTRHIRRSMQILDSGDQATVAAYDASARRLVLVTVRGDTTQRVTYDLSRFTSVGGSSGGAVRRWTTDASPSGSIYRQYLRESDVLLSGKSLTVEHQLYTVTTLEIDNVVP
jgi:galactan endo-1,6-beta-galactosidase